MEFLGIEFGSGCVLSGFQLGKDKCSLIIFMNSSLEGEVLDLKEYKPLPTSTVRSSSKMASCKTIDRAVYLVSIVVVVTILCILETQRIGKLAISMM